MGQMENVIKFGVFATEWDYLILAGRRTGNNVQGECPNWIISPSFDADCDGDVFLGLYD